MRGGGSKPARAGAAKTDGRSHVHTACLREGVVGKILTVGYFVADQSIKEFMPDLMGGRPAGGWYSGPPRAGLATRA